MTKKLVKTKQYHCNVKGCPRHNKKACLYKYHNHKDELIECPKIGCKVCEKLAKELRAVYCPCGTMISMNNSNFKKNHFIFT